MSHYEQGDILYVDLDPSKGVEMKKKRPCVVVSNKNYNRLLNTIIVAPISSSEKYLTDKKYLESPLFIQVPENPKIKGTILMQHLRSIVPNIRINGKNIFRLDSKMISMIQNVVLNFF